MAPQSPLQLRLQALAGVVGISFSAIFVRLSEASPSTAAFFRALYAVPLLALLWWRVRGRDHRGRNARLLAVASGLILGADFAVWHRSIGSIGAGLATVLGNTQVFWVAIAAWWLFGERPRKMLLWMLPLLFGGVVLTSGLGRPDAYGDAPLRGVIYGCATGVFYASFLLTFRRARRGDTPTIGPWLDATLGTVAATWLLGTLDGELDYAVSWPQHGWLLALALTAQVFGWLLITRSLPKMPAIETSILLLAQPVLTLVWGMLLLGESLSPVQALGAAMVVVGIAVVSLPRGAAGPAA